MPNKCKIYKPEFRSLREENEYLSGKIEFLLSHAESLAKGQIEYTHVQPNTQLKELRDIKNSRSWRITRPLREASRIFQQLLMKNRRSIEEMTERDESFSLANIDAEIGVKDVYPQDDKYLINFFIFNRGEVTIPCKARNGKQLFVSFHLRDPEGEMLSWDNPRLPLKQDVGPKEIYGDSFFVEVPRSASGMWIDIDILDEGIGWYSAEQNHRPNSFFIKYGDKYL
jgi:hypothetical protein